MSGKGRIYPPLAERFWQKVDKTPGHGPEGDCWIWTGCIVGFGYGQIGRSKEDGGRVEYTHRISYELHYGVSLGTARVGPLVLHKCDVPACVNPDHLFLGTDQDNNDDMRQKGRWSTGNQKGEANPNRILTDEVVRSIRSATGTFQSIADSFGVSLTTAWNVKNRKTWTHVQ